MKNRNLIYLLLFFINIANGNPINDISIQNQDNQYNFYIEIPAGTKEKWEVDKVDGQLKINKRRNGNNRIIEYLAYPGNYGFIPQTLAGDGDAIDVIDIDAFEERGSTKVVKILGGLYFKDKKEEDVKIIATGINGTMANFNSIDEIFFDKPTILELLKLWFLNYKKPGKMVFYKFLSQDESIKLISDGHKKWKENAK